MNLEYNYDWKWTNGATDRPTDRPTDRRNRTSELLQHIVNIELIQPAHYQRNNGCKTGVMTPYTTT